LVPSKALDDMAQMSQTAADLPNCMLSDDDWEALREMMEWLLVGYPGTFV
jgi:hypothetical protein